MVGIVIIAHSQQLAAGIREMAAQMVQGRVSLAVAAGSENLQNTLGTDAIQVYEAIASVFHDDGVVILMDLGSAITSAEMALEYLSPEHQQKVHLCAAPLVEGAIAAVIAAAARKNVMEVIAAAQGALAAKITRLGLTTGSQNLKEIRLLVTNQLGLHARPASKFVTTAAKFQAQIKVKNSTKNTDFVRADSINQVVTLGVMSGDEILVTAQGMEADAALQALETLVVTNFGEVGAVNLTDVVPKITPSIGNSHLPPPHFQGIAAASGVAIAPSLSLKPTRLSTHPFLPVSQYHVEYPEVEWQRLHTALGIAYREIQALLSHASMQIGDTEAAIFDAHILFLEDPTLLEAIHQQIFDHHCNAEAAWCAVVEELSHNYRTLDDPYLQTRVADISDVGQRVLRLLMDAPETTIEVLQPSILIATELSPSDTAKLDPTRVLGICITGGSPSSHSAILARSLGIPAVVGVSEEILHLANGTILAIDGEIGHIWVEPDAEMGRIFQHKRETWLQNQDIHPIMEAAGTRDTPKEPLCDRHPIRVFANIGSLEDTQMAIANGAEGIGLLRTEFLYFHRSQLPNEGEQLLMYQQIADILTHRPLIIRTLDIGGDKTIPYLNLPKEINPFLGFRGIRIGLHQPQILKTQLRAILRASARHNIKIMFPMIATVGEIRAAKMILQEAQTELRQESISFASEIEIGIMVEVPAAVAIADQLAREVDFFSIGTNDLTQYIMAADRNNPRTANLADGLNPAILRMIHQTIQAAHQAGIWVGLCGELAADPLALPILMGLGIDELSVNPPAITPLKQAITQLNLSDIQAIATQALQQDSAMSVRSLVAALKFFT
ncbi:phosphoenolpyruvate--protein phosphotransferase [Calothrix sp. 336/3]|uniref:phosphoenolpyruvate--protein phosphotransferase n=1 Tax=Calothrix sp. 336/3 TaxID=1337936 RepID=UPI0004E44CD9|nr:phosphoenolpyruvate--protein phosphotransferase [Calothrix sp. 336/3]AKG21807.1 phosphoenolpyruvate-protein phosphotransferase [Calothrix sp. 336/3]